MVSCTLWVKVFFSRPTSVPVGSEDCVSRYLHSSVQPRRRYAKRAVARLGLSEVQRYGTSREKSVAR
jgi:hypothetical protein